MNVIKLENSYNFFYTDEPKPISTIDISKAASVEKDGVNLTFRVVTSYRV